VTAGDERPTHREEKQDMAQHIGQHVLRAPASDKGLGMAGRLHLRLLAPVVLLTAAVAVPFLLSEFKVGLIGLGLTYGLFAVGLDLAWGRTGIVSIGHAVFFGLGVYGVAIAITRGFSPELGGLIAVVIAGGAGALTAAAGLRRSTNPSTMAVLTLAITLLAEKVARDWWPVTGGSSGLFVPPLAGTTAYYWICLAAITVIVAALWFGVLNRPLGNRLTAIRLNDRRAEHLGIPVFQGRVIAFTLSAVVAAIAGALSAPWMSSVSPDRVGIVLSTQVLVWVAIGGKNSILGPMLGAVALTYGQDALASTLGSYYLLILGLLFIVSVLLVPNGIAGVFRTREHLAETTPAAAAIPGARRTGGDDALACADIEKHFAGNRVLNGVSLAVKPAEIVCLIGPNGAGKSTLLNVFSGALAPDAGTVTLGGQRIDQTPPHERVAAGLARTFQVPSLFAGLTVNEHLMLARQEAGFVAPLATDYAALEARHGDQRVETLSLGDRRSLEIAMALCSRPDVLLLDEPAAGLARNDAGRLAKTLRALRDEAGCAIVCVEHDMEIVRDLADRVICLHHGGIISEGTMDAVSADPIVRRAYLGMA
jgi:branched-chain amino acid transport system permease protein